MRHEVTLPKLGDTVSAVVVLEWQVNVGDSIAQGDPVLTVETDKIEADVPSPVAGRVVEQLVAPGDEVTVGAPIVIVEA